MPQSLSFRIDHASGVGAARREVMNLCGTLGFCETEAGKAGVVVTEFGSNLAKYGREGLIVLRVLEASDEKDRGLEILSIDRGPGMEDVSRCLEDGYSTAGSPGTGLGAVRRLASVFDVFSEVGKGTVLLAQFWSRPPGQRKPGRFEVGAISLPKTAGDECGDGWCVTQTERATNVLVADGLGHGPLAAKAANESVRVFSSLGGQKPDEVVRAMHGPLRSTRGASLAIAQLPLAGDVRYTGVGNIVGVLVSSSNTTRNMVSHNGTVGHEVHKIAEFLYPWQPGSLLIMHSDGLSRRWSLADYPGLISRHPSVIAGVLFRDFARVADDSTVVVLKEWQK